MAHRPGLNDLQTAVLAWIGDGCPAGVFDGTAHRVTAAALRRRGLVLTDGRGDAWCAELTDAGREYLDQVEAGTAPPQRQSNVPVTEQLIAEVAAAGGTRTYPRPGWGRGDIDYARRADLAIRHNKVPPGKRLLVRRTDDGIEITLADPPPGAPVGPPPPVPVPRQVRGYHPAVQTFRQTTQRHEVTRRQLNRASRILHALATVVEAHGWTAEPPRPASSTAFSNRRDDGEGGHLVVVTDAYRAQLWISEDGLGSRARWERTRTTRYWSASGNDYSTSKPVSDYEKGANGRLRIKMLGHAPGGRVAQWGDTRSWQLDDKLGEILHEVQLRTAEAHEAQTAEQRALAERERTWRTAMAEARAAHAEAGRATELARQVAAWTEAQQVRAYCTAALERHPDDPGTAAWVEWALAHAEHLDPLAAPPAPPELREPSLDELRPFLPGRNPFEFSW